MHVRSRSGGVVTTTKLFTYDIVADPGFYIYDPINERIIALNKKRLEKIKSLKQNIIPQ
jgi:hypothetical protein